MESIKKQDYRNEVIITAKYGKRRLKNDRVLVRISVAVQNA